MALPSSLNFLAPRVPDLTEHRLRALHPGNLREHLAERFLATLRQLTRRHPGSLGLGVRAIFQPKQPAYERLAWSVSAQMAKGSFNEDELLALTARAPYSQFYELTPASDAPDWCAGLGGYAEVVRLETCVRPSVTQEDNPHVPKVGYYAVSRLKPRPGNDWLLLDRALSEGVQEHAVIDILVTPVAVAEEQTAWNHWWAALRKVNSLDPSEEHASPYGWSEHRTREPHLVRDPLADDFAREAQEQLAALRQPHLKFALRVLAETPERATALAALVAECAFEDDQYQLIGLSADDPALPAAIAAVIERRVFDETCSPQVFGVQTASELRERLSEGMWGLRRVVRLATPSELSGLFRLPMTAGAAPRCMRRTTDPAPVAYREPTAAGAGRIRSVTVGYDLESGQQPHLQARLSGVAIEALLEGSSSTPLLRLELEQLKKHMFVAGAPGSGKTIASLNLLTQLYRAGIPWLVIEPAKTEYRVLAALSGHPDPAIRRMAREVRVLTPGNEHLSPMRLNPFAYPRGGNRDEHIELLFMCFKAAFPMFTPLDGLLLEAIERAYDEAGDEHTPTLDSLLAVARDVLRSKGYSNEVRSNLEGALDVRVGGLTRRSVGKIFASGLSFPDTRELLAYPTVLELEHLGPDNAAFLTLLVLASMRESFRHASPEEGGRHSGSALKHVTLIEEAHNLVGFTGPAPSDDSANPRYHAAQFVARMLAEVRALGEGLIIVDQLPSAVAPEVVKNTGIKYAGRLVSGDDRETMAAAMMLDPAQTDELARLGVGDAYLYHERFHAPRRCAGLDAYSYLELAGAPGDSELIDLQERVYGSGIREVLSERSWFLDHGRLLANELDEEVNIALEQILKIVVASMGDGPGLTAPVLRVKLERTYQQLYARVEALLARGGLREDDLELVHSAFLRLNGGISKSLAIVKQLEEDGAPGGEP